MNYHLAKYYDKLDNLLMKWRQEQVIIIIVTRPWVIMNIDIINKQYTSIMAYIFFYSAINRVFCMLLDIFYKKMDFLYYNKSTLTMKGDQNINICANAIYKIKTFDKNGVSTYSKNPHTFEQLKSKWSIAEIKQFLITKAIIIQYCGKCEYCLNMKKQKYQKRVSSQFKQSKYSYLITLTMDDLNIDTLLLDQQRLNILEYSTLSNHSNLSKIRINNIIKNWKNKINRYYKEKIKLNYFLCGEYGENTDRAHYHILLMMDVPLPHLKKEPVKGNHFKSKIIDSKQYDLYDIQPTNGDLSCSSYISKYLTKQSDYSKLNYNQFEQEQIKWYLENNIDIADYFVIKSNKFIPHLTNFFVNQSWYCYYYFVKNFKFQVFKLRPIVKQKPFIKQSQKLGISDDPYFNQQQGTINYYYKYRYEFYQLRTFNQIKWSNSAYLWFIYLYYDQALKHYEIKRRKNILEYFYNSPRTRNEKYNNKDIF